MQLFRRMGYVSGSILNRWYNCSCILSRPRVILVEDQGALCGLVTVKDVLKYTLTETGEIRPSYDAEQFEGIIEQTWTWITARTHDLVSLSVQLFRRIRR